MSHFEKPTWIIDTQEFEHYLDDPAMSEEQKKEVLETLWGIICEFVFLGFGVTSVQQIKQQSCGKEDQTFWEPTQTDSPAIESEHRGLVNAFVEAYAQEEGEKIDA